MAALAVLGVFTAGCSAGGTGLRDNGPAAGETAKNPGPTSPVSPAPGAKLKTPDAVELLRRDPGIDQRIKKDLKPCAEGAYPVDMALGHLTGGSVPDIVVNVTSCADGVAVGSFVYRLNGSAYQNVFATVEPAVYSSIDRDDLVVTKQVYETADPIATPTAEEVTTYRWSATSGSVSGRFVQTHWSRTQYGGMPSAAGETFVVPGKQSAPPPARSHPGFVVGTGGTESEEPSRTVVLPGAEGP
ncbi:hypothetical protein ACWDR0_22710 [Streptomyces sp. NPDC003691]